MTPEVTPHVTHFHDCGCRSAEYKRRIAALERLLVDALLANGAKLTPDGEVPSGAQACPTAADSHPPWTPAGNWWPKHRYWGHQG